ncbi:Na+/H+ antiporter NhaA [gamma proteobacterium HTCC5015]|nr:Na+/H+ antiporter NhaA [gamma proteobacterium HTCC5015]
MRNIKTENQRGQQKTSLFDKLRELFRGDTAGGAVLMVATILAILVANSPWAHFYHDFIEMPVEIRIGLFQIDKPLLLWINDGLMAIFFFTIGLELKREVLEGELSELSKISLPAFGAVGGMLIPAAIYAAINWDNPENLRGWAIPAATDIAFALGILALVGSRVPLALKVFLTSLAVFDDIGAIIIIAIFYSHEMSLVALGTALACVVVLYIMNRRGVSDAAPYLLVGLIMWASVLKSGVHATLAGVVLGLFIPMHHKKHPEVTPLRDLEHDLHGAVAFGILPLFAFVNAGLDLRGITLEQTLHPVPVGIALGLFLGKQLGVMAFCWAAVKLKLARLPSTVGWHELYSVALLSGIGFTMSLFIGGLAFEGVEKPFDERLGIIIGSLLSGVVGYIVLKRSARGGEAY